MRADAADITALDRPVALSFAHEMNGSWDQWGCHHTPAAVFTAAWRHIHRILHGRLITWVWNINRVWSGSCPIRALYPGAAYVNWVGIDGYLRDPWDTFRQIFGPTVARVRSFTSKPILLAEAGVPAGPHVARRIVSLYSGARADHLIGIVYFDSATRKGDYRPQDNPAALAAFRKAAKG